MQSELCKSTTAALYNIYQKIMNKSRVNTRNGENMSKRSEIQKVYQWNMKDVYASETLWEEDALRAEEMFRNLQDKKGKLCKSKQDFAESMTLIRDVEYCVEKLYFYANQKYHEDLGCGTYQVMAAKAGDLMNAFYEISAFVEPEFLTESEETILGYLESEELAEFRQYFRNLFRQKAHIRSDEVEEILAATQNITQAPGDIFQIFNNADLKFPKIKDATGELVQLTHSKYGLFLESSNREVRQQAFEELYKTYGAYRNTIATVYIASIKKDVFYAKVRNYRSSRELYLSDSHIPEEVYDNLLKTVEERLTLLHRYVALRKRALQLEEVHMYDLYTPMVNSVSFDIPYEQAKEMVLEGLAPMGEEYTGLLREGFESGWIDVYENEGKRSGAYSWSIYGVHPYVLLNYQPNLNHVFTLAHEMGHALHSYYSNQAQPYTNADYKIFVAEVASTCNEALLIRHLIDKAESRDEKAYLINHFLEQFRTTLFRQTMFAEFENNIHNMAEAGVPLNQEVLCEQYYQLNQKYFGADAVIDKDIELEWARIPHFYTPFYVYQYATGFSAAIALSEKILEQGESAVEDYKRFLKGGSSDDPIALLKLAGVDMGTKEPIEAALQVFEALLTELEALL